MDYRFRFTLEKQEYRNFLKNQSMLLKKNRWKRAWLIMGVPTLLLCSVLYFGWYRSVLWVIAALMLAGVWALEIGPALWRRHMDRRFEKAVQETGEDWHFAETELDFNEDSVTVRSPGSSRVLPYQELSAFVPMGELFVFSAGADKTLLLPFRVFMDESEMKAFIADFSKARLAHTGQKETA